MKLKTKVQNFVHGIRRFAKKQLKAFSRVFKGNCFPFSRVFSLNNVNRLLERGKIISAIKRGKKAIYQGYFR